MPEERFPLASHDDTTVEYVRENAGHGVRIAELPTTLEAARESRAQGMAVIMGAPNVVRGGSHSGNVAAVELAREGLLDILSSGYMPASLLRAAFPLPELAGMSLAEALAVTSAPARAARAIGLNDRASLPQASGPMRYGFGWSTACPWSGLSAGKANRCCDRMLPILPRYAVYSVPERDSVLERLGSHLLGRDVHSGGRLSQPVMDGIAQEELWALTCEARRYGLQPR